MMRSSLAFSAITALVVAAASAHALESSMTVRSPLSPGELWNKIGDFCAMSEWDPAVELCHLSADGKQRTTVLFGEVVRVVAALEDWDEVNRSYAHVSELAPVKHYHARVRVIADGQTSVLKLTASYEANGVSDTEAQKIIDGTMYRSLCIGGPLLCSDDPHSATPAEVVGFEGQSFISTALTLRGYLRRPDGAGPFPAIVLLHGCNGFPEQLDQNWGVKITAWGYVTLTVDSARGWLSALSK
jgi:Polyketide cyclase / dehydrase and lipid transport